MINFLFGRAGSGKTSYIIEKIKNNVSEGKKTYLLVPEQQAFISECMLADLPPSSALCFEIVSFSRLCEIVFGKLGGLVDSKISSGMRNLIMWQDLREVSSFLQEYKGIKTDASLGAMMLSAIDELKANGIRAEDCEAIADKCENEALSRKLHDLTLIYENFNRGIEQRLGEGALASENKLSRLADALKDCDLFDGCEFFVDSFTSFTGEEHLILEEIAAGAELFCISFCYEGRGSASPHNDSVRDTVKRFTKFAKDNGIEYTDTLLGSNVRAVSEELRLIDSHLWDFSYRRSDAEAIAEESSKATEAVEMYVCKNEYEEAYLAALKIIDAHKKGAKFSEIALIMRDTESRKGVIDAVFERFGIPFFYSDKTDLSSTAVSRLILSALRCISYNFQTSDVLTLLKTGLCGIDPEKADLFEEYCYTWNISGNRFLDDVWSMNPDGYTINISNRGKEILSAANAVKNELITPLARLKKKISEACGNTEQNCRAVYEYLDEIKLSQNLCSLAEFELASGNIKESGEILRVYDLLVSSLTEICTTLADAPTNAEELAAAIEIMMKHTDIGSVPAVGDYVTVGSAATLRVENVKMAILVGLCEGEFPQGFSDNGLLTENDKSILEDLGLALSSREGRVMSDELFHAWRAMTKPSERLILSTCSSSVGGKASTPSSAWNRVAFLLPHIKPKTFSLDKIRSLSLDREESEHEEIDADDIVNISRDEECEVKIDPLYVRMLFGDRLHLSKSQISAFAECPYKYWCEYVLRLRETKISTIGYADAGTIIHYVLEKLLSMLKNDDGSLKEIEDDEVIRLVNDILKQYILEINCPVSPASNYNFSRLRDLSLVMARSVIDEFRHSSFKIVAFEQPISDKRKDALRPMEIKVDDGEGSPVVSLGGVIDRIDCYDDGENRYLRVIDYKTGAHKYNVEKLSTGEDLQLPAYLFTAAQDENKEFFGVDRNIRPASALFLSADEQKGVITPVRSGFILGNRDILAAASSEMDKNILAGISINKKDELSGRAMVNEEEIERMNETLRSTIADTARDMYSGKAMRTPSKEACGFCPIKASCPVAHKDK